MAQKKHAAKRNTKRKSTKRKKTSKKVVVTLNKNQSSLVKNLASERRFISSAAHRKTQQSIIDKGLAVTDKTGTKIKATAIGRKHAKKI